MSKRKPVTWDWTVFDDERCDSVAQAAAEKMSRDYARVLDFDDALQHARMYLASHPEAVREALSDEGISTGALFYRVKRELQKIVQTPLRRAARTFSRDAWLERYGAAA